MFLVLPFFCSFFGTENADIIFGKAGLTYEKKKILRENYHYSDRPFFRDSSRGLGFNRIGYDLAEVHEFFYL